MGSSKPIPNGTNPSSESLDDGKTNMSDLAENFSINVVRAIESILKFSDLTGGRSHFA